MTSITPYLWFDNDAEEAIDFYTALFPEAKVGAVARYPAGMPNAGTFMNAEFELAGQKFIALNGGPQFAFTEAVSFFVSVETQDEVDRYWDALTSDGGEESQCGWLKDRWGLSWQIVPTALMHLLRSPDHEVAGRVTQSMLKMRKIVIADLEAAAAG